VNCDAQKSLCEKEGVSSHPTLIKYTQDNMKEADKGFGGEVYSGKHEIDALKLFVEDPAEYKVQLDKIIAEEKAKKGNEGTGASDEDDL
jgi:hypothetical protein